MAGNNYSPIINAIAALTEQSDIDNLILGLQESTEPSVVAVVAGLSGGGNDPIIDKILALNGTKGKTKRLALVKELEQTKKGNNARCILSGQSFISNK